jgi:hypothetical protein
VKRKVPEEEKEKVVAGSNPIGKGVNSPSRVRPQVWERDENGAVRKCSLKNAVYNLAVGTAAFLSVRMPEGGWLHVELVDPDYPEDGVYVTRTSVNTATRTHYTRAMRFYETRKMSIENFERMVRASQRGVEAIE